MDDHQVEMQIRVMAIELAIKGREPNQEISTTVEHAKAIMEFIKGV